jgi:hypothetical protein
MPYFYDRVKETTTTTGTGTLTLGGAVSGYRTFSSVLSNSDTCYYTIDDGNNNWECGVGTYSSGTLDRTTVTASTNSNMAVDFSAGTKKVWIDASAYALNQYPMPITFILAQGVPAVTGTNLTNISIAATNGVINKCWIAAKTGPTDADLICDINLNGTSIWNSNQGNRITIPDGSTTGTQTNFDTTVVSAGDQLTIDIDQIGATIAGQDITVVLLINFFNK